MGRLVGLGVFLLLLTGCSSQDQAPKITRDEYDEFQRHSTLADQPTAEMMRYVASDRGKDIVSRRLRMIFSDRGIATLRGATRVDTYRIVDPQLHPKVGGFRRVEAYPVTARGPQKGAPFAARLADAVLDGTRYFMSFDCFHDQGVAFQAWKGNESVTLTMCCSCNALEVYVRDSWGWLVHQGFACHYDPLLGPVELVRLARESFPSDPAIQALSDQTTPMVTVSPAPDHVDR